MQTNEFILGDRRLHRRLFLTTAILGKFIMSDGATYTSEYLAREIGCKKGVVEDLCIILNRHGIISRLHKNACTEEWSLICNSAMITLGDVYTAIATSSPLFEDEHLPNVVEADRTREAELLVSQAALDINELVLRHLKQFFLSSLKA